MNIVLYRTTSPHAPHHRQSARPSYHPNLQHSASKAAENPSAIANRAAGAVRSPPAQARRPLRRLYCPKAPSTLLNYGDSLSGARMRCCWM